jgi:hypothetical protein
MSMADTSAAPSATPLVSARPRRVRIAASIAHQASGCGKCVKLASAFSRTGRSTSGDLLSKKPDHRHRRLLRPRRERPSRCAAEKRDELAPFYI